MSHTAPTPELVPLDVALALYRGVSIRMARAWIASGRLPAVKAGRCYLIRPADLAALLVPTARTPGERRDPAATRAAALSAAGLVARRA